jgi:hypothetical protein
MAVRKNNPMGSIQGTLGHTVTRIRNGKEVVYILPDKVKISQSTAAKAARRKFGLTVNFAKFVNSFPALSGIWSYANISGTNSYQKLIKHNAGLTCENSLTLNNIITPEGIPLQTEDFSFNNETFSFSFNLIDRNNANDLIFPAQIYSVLYFYEPKNKNRESFLFSLLTQEIEEPQSGENLIIRLNLDATQLKNASLYNKCIIYSALMFSKIDMDNPVWSSTIARQIDLN